MEPNKQAEREEMEIDLGGLLRLYRQKIKQIVVVFLLFAILAGVGSRFLIAPKYQATSKIYIASASSETGVNMSDLQVGATLTADYKVLLLSRPVLESVMRNQNPNVSDVDALKDMIRIENPQGTRILNITVTSTNPAESAKIANELAHLAEGWLPQMMGSDAPYIAEEAVVPEKKVAPSNAKNALLGGLVALVVYLIIETIRYVRDDTVQNAEEFERYFDIVPLAAIPKEDVVDYRDKGKKKGPPATDAARPSASKAAVRPAAGSTRTGTGAVHKSEQKKGMRQV